MLICVKFILLSKINYVIIILSTIKQKQLFIEKENSKDKQFTPNTDNIWLIFKIMESNFK